MPAALRALVVVAALTAAGCATPPAQRARVHGSVTLDGKPLAAGKVRFFALTGGVGTDGDVVAGRYDIAPERGLTAGTYRVEVSAERSTGRKVPDRDGAAGAMHDEVVESIPAKYNRESLLKVDYDPTSDKPHDFVLLSR